MLEMLGGETDELTRVTLGVSGISPEPGAAGAAAADAGLAAPEAAADAAGLAGALPAAGAVPPQPARLAAMTISAAHAPSSLTLALSRRGGRGDTHASCILILSSS